MDGDDDDEEEEEVTDDEDGEDEDDSGGGGGGDDNDDDDLVLYNTVTPCYCSMLGALGRIVSVEACCQWLFILSVQITRHYPATYIYCTEVPLSFCKVHVGSFCVSVIR